MKLVACSDAHLDFSTAGVSRFAEVSRALDVVADHAIATCADVFFFLGDAMDPDSGSRVFRCIEVLLRTAIKLRAARISSIWIAGNHDVIEDGSGDTTLSPLRALEDSTRSKRAIGGGDTGVFVVERPEEISIDLRGKRIDLLALPYCAASHRYDPASFVAKSDSLAADSSLIVAGHATDIPGATFGEERGEMARGRGMTFPLEAIAERRRRKPTLLLNGHVHRAQCAVLPEFEEFPILIPGGLARFTFGEAEHSPGWIDAEI